MGLFSSDTPPRRVTISPQEAERWIDQQMRGMQAQRHQADWARMYQLYPSQSLGLADWNAAFAVMDGDPVPPYDATDYPYDNIFGEIIAWRSWKWKDGALVSPYQNTAWAPGEIIEAHESPFKGKNSGIFCHKTVEDVFDQENSWQVVGTVLIWGDVMEHEKGYRAEFAKPYKIKHFRPHLADTIKQYVESVFSHCG